MKRGVYLVLSSVLMSGAGVATTGGAQMLSPRSGAGASAAAQDGDPQPGLTSPNPRFRKNGDGTVTDSLTGLIWLQDASCASLPKTDASGRAFGATAIAATNELADPECGLSDGSRAGDWRLPSRFELESLLDLEFHDPALSNAAGTAKWSAGDPFSGVESSCYWSSATLATDATYVWCVDLLDGLVFYVYEVHYYYVWPVRGGRRQGQ